MNQPTERSVRPRKEGVPVQPAMPRLYNLWLPEIVQYSERLSGSLIRKFQRPEGEAKGTVEDFRQGTVRGQKFIPEEIESLGGVSDC